MKAKLSRQLNQLNKKFYSSQAQSFSSTRQEKWQGWEILLPNFTGGVTVLDVGCGNGRFAKFLAKNRVDIGRYIGIDSSEELVEIAKKEMGKVLPSFENKFIVANVMDLPELEKKLGGKKFDRIVVFGLMHHIPGFENRITLLEALSNALTRDGQIYVTFWQFFRSNRAKNWPMPDSEVERLLGESVKDLEKGDYLLDWDNSGQPRFCHYFSEEEVDKMARELVGSGLTLIKDFNADGKEGNLNRYLVLKKSEIEA